ncbi:MAG: phosphomannomutase [Planctomycetaceae bacterium]|nr:MAG: phosphomannomutase [Planctomycetaceae bacterium]
MGGDSATTWLSEDISAWLQRAKEDGELTTQTVANIRRWLTSPAYAEFRPSLLELLRRRDTKELTRLFWQQIPFGTGGRRGPMAELGSATMNRRTIAESAWGLARYVLEARQQLTPKHDPPRVVIGYDSRLRSEEFARLTAEVMAAQGFEVSCFPKPRATPQLSFWVRRLQADCGVMITASHNPPSDNGFKAYWSHGGQVVPPHDLGIIRWVEAAGDIPRIPWESGLAAGQIRLLSERHDADYCDFVCGLSLSRARQIPALYSPLHGVGAYSVYAVVQAAGFEHVELFTPQAQPNGHFPGVPDQLPNPERREVFEPLMQAARKEQCMLLASDPDADRIAVAVRETLSTHAPWRCLTGNQLAAIVTDHVLHQRRNQNRWHPADYVLETLVTTPLVARIAREYGVQVEINLPVGFKNLAAEVERRGSEHFVLGVEESLGFMAGDALRDKDAAVGALWALECAAEEYAAGRTLWDRLISLYRQHGVHVEGQWTQEYPGPRGAQQMQQVIDVCRQQPPTSWGNVSFEILEDYGEGIVWHLPTHRMLREVQVPAGDLLIFRGTAHESYVGPPAQVQVALRPSGTEPKIKAYLFAQLPPQHETLGAWQQAQRVLQHLQDSLSQWLKRVSEL